MPISTDTSGHVPTIKKALRSSRSGASRIQLPPRVPGRPFRGTTQLSDFTTSRVLAPIPVLRLTTRGYENFAVLASKPRRTLSLIEPDRQGGQGGADYLHGGRLDQGAVPIRPGSAGSLSSQVLHTDVYIPLNTSSAVRRADLAPAPARSLSRDSALSDHAAVHDIASSGLGPALRGVRRPTSQ